MKLTLSLFLLLCSLASALAFAQPQFPVLNDRVVDNANLLSAETRTDLISLLLAHEQKTSNQVVVATLAQLDGYDIADYANRLFRHWQLGQQDKDNGILLLVAISERKVRIEVGYGLEGALTDALSSQIIRNEITPAFKQNDFDRGINQGVRSILAAIEGEYVLEEGTGSHEESLFGQIIPFIMFGAAGGQLLLGRVLGNRKKRETKTKAIAALGVGTVVGVVGGIILASVFLGLLAAIGCALLSFFFMGSHSVGSGRGHRGGFGGGGFGGGSGGGFRGGGGSSGGGGASGGW